MQENIVQSCVSPYCLCFTFFYKGDVFESILQSNIQHSVLLPSTHTFTIVRQVKGNFVIEHVLDIIAMFPLHFHVEGYGLTMMIGYGQLLIICTIVTMLSSI